MSGFRVAAECRAAGGLLGGDFYRLLPHAPGRMGVVIGDTCGQGPVAAGFFAAVKPHLDELVLSQPSPADLLTELNRVASRLLPLDRFITAAAFEFDARAGLLTIANAGHVPAIIRSVDGSVAVVGEASGPPLGIDRDFRYQDEDHELRRGDVVVMMTDGLLEAVELDLTSMGTLRRWLAQGPAEALNLHRLLLGKLEEEAARRHEDDVTLVTLETPRESLLPPSIQ